MGKTRSRRSQILAEKREDVARMVHATVSYAAFGMAVMLATAAASAAMIVIGAKTGSPLMTVTGALVLALSIGSIFLPT